MFVCVSFSSILILFLCAVRLMKVLAYVFVCWLQFLCLWDALVSVACVFSFVGGFGLGRGDTGHLIPVLVQERQRIRPSTKSLGFVVLGNT